MPKRLPKTPKKTPARVKAPAKGYARLVTAIESANLQMTGRAASLVNQALVIRNWLIGAYIVEYEQGGADRAKYGAKLLERLAKDLEKRGLKGFNVTLLKLCRLCYHAYPQIRPTLSDESDGRLLPLAIRPTVSDELAQHKNPAVSSTTSSRSLDTQPTPLTVEAVLRFSWSKLVDLLAIEDPWKRAFFENECLKGNWSVRQLRRQIESLLYERTGLSKNKRALVERARTAGVKETVEDLIRDPYVLEFIGLAEREEYSENELESALLDHLQRFLLELGEGFCFEARQFRITVNNKHDRLDLLFYHRLLRCHVLVDLKIRAFRHTDAGQMNFYLNWFKAHMQAEGDNPPVGILLCSGKDGTEVEFATAGMDSQMFVSRYLVALPSAEQLRKFVEADRAQIELATDPD